MKKYKLGKVCNLNERTISRLDNVEIEYLDTGSITENCIASTQRVLLFDAPSRAQRLVKHHTIIYSLVRPKLGHHGIMDSPPNNLVVSTGFATIDIKDEFKKDIDPYYLYIYLSQNHITQHLNAIAENSVSAYPALVPKNLADQELRLPSLVEQRRIGEMFSTIDQKIALNRAINHNLEALITDIVDYEYLSNINSLSKRQIGDIASIKAGGDCPLEWSKERTEEFNIPIFSNGIENDGLYGYAKQATIFKPGITVAARGTIGFCALREANYVPIIRLLAVTPHDKGGEIYLHQILNRITFKKDGSIQQQLTVPALSCIAIPYPDSIQLALFATKVYPIVEKIRFCKEQNEKLTKLRDSLLPLLMNGQMSLNYDLSHD